MEVIVYNCLDKFLCKCYLRNAPRHDLEETLVFHVFQRCIHRGHFLWRKGPAAEMVQENLLPMTHTSYQYPVAFAHPNPH